MSILEQLANASEGAYNQFRQNLNQFGQNIGQGLNQVGQSVGQTVSNIGQNLGQNFGELGQRIGQNLGIGQNGQPTEQMQSQMGLNGQIVQNGQRTYSPIPYGQISSYGFPTGGGGESSQSLGLTSKSELRRGRPGKGVKKIKN